MNEKNIQREQMLLEMLFEKNVIIKALQERNKALEEMVTKEETNTNKKG